jgi:hypothetical protein
MRRLLRELATEGKVTDDTTMLGEFRGWKNCETIMS